MSAELACTYWPALRNAVQPAPIPRQAFKGAFRVAAEWAQLVQRVERGEFRLRAPASSPRGLCGPIVGLGSCLNPVFLEGDVYWIDPTMQAEDGDFVMLQWHPEKLRGIVERGRLKPEWLAEYGPNPGDSAMKQLRRFGNEYITVTRHSCMPLGASPFYGGEDRILGTVRYVERNGRPIYGCGPLVVHTMDLNAATEVYRIEEAGSDIGDPVEDELSITLEEQATVHVEARCSSLTGGGANIAQWTPYVGATDGKTIPTEDSSGNGIDNPIVVHSFDVAAGTYDVGVRADAAGGGNVTVSDRFITITVIKR